MADDLYTRAVALVREHGRVSTSWLQRQLRVSYNSAAQLIEQLEKDGVVSAPTPIGLRTVIGFDEQKRSEPEAQLQIPVDLPNKHREADDRLRLLIERVERLEEEKKGVSDDIRDVYAEGKAVGYDAKMMRECVRLRKMKPDDRREMELILDTYKAALGLG